MRRLFLVLCLLAGCDSLPEQVVSVPCSAHTDCQSLVCDSYGDLVGSGQCVPQGSIVYVNSGGPNCENGFDGQATGGMTDPVCTIQGALDVMGSRKFIRVLASSTAYPFPEKIAPGKPVFLIGPGAFAAGKAASLVPHANDNGPASTDLLLDGLSVVLDGFAIIPDGRLGGSSPCKVTIRRSLLNFVSAGVSFDGCTVEFDRVMMSNTPALAFKDSQVRVTNSFFIGNTAPGSLIDLSGGSGSFQFNTVAGNIRQAGGPAGPVLSCSSPSPIEIKNSIFALNEGGQVAQIGSGCKLVGNSLVLGSADPTPGQVRQDPVFAGPQMLDFRLRPQDARNQQYLIDKAVAVNPAERNVDHDYFGMTRPQGNGYDIGAHEAQ